MPGPLDVTAPIYLPDPVERSHPLNRGRLAWWLALPGLDGGRRLYDLLGLNHGTLTNMGAGSGWRPTTRPGGFGHLLYDGVDDQVDCGTGAKVTTGQITVACWWRPTGTSRSDIFTRWVNGSTAGDQFQLLAGLTAGKPQVFFNTGGGVHGSGVGPTAMAAGTWHRIVATYDGATAAVYLDGRLEASTTSAANLAAPNDTVSYLIGNSHQPDGPASGALDDVSVWSRALSASEVAEDYRLSQAGYPGLLNRLAPLAPAAAVANNYNLAGGTGTFAEAGSPASLLVGRRLAAAAGSYAEAGGPAILLARRVLAGGTGSFALTGGDAALIRSGLLALDGGTGAYTLAGGAAGLVAGRRLAAAAGSYAVAGGAAGLVIHRILAAAGGTTTLASDGAALVYTPAGGSTYTLAAAGGAFLESGGVAALIRRLILPAAPGTFAPGPTSAALLASNASGDLKQALFFALVNSPALSALVGTRVYPGYLPQAATRPAVAYRFLAVDRPFVLNAASGLRTATVRFEAEAALESDLEAIREAVRNLLQNRTGPINGFRIVSSVFADESDGAYEPVPGSDEWTLFKRLDFKIKCQESLPTYV